MRIVSYTRTTSCFPDVPIEPDAITRQNERIKDYASLHGWRIADKYSDRKKSMEENQAFEKLLQDGMHRKFDAVIVDSIYRAGTDLGSAREVLLQTLHYSGISFVVVEDDFIGIGRTNEEVERYFEEKYTVFRRENMRHIVGKRNREGILSWSDAKYGYRLTEDNKLVIDEETGPVVKRIFRMCADGISPAKVAEKLSEEKVPSPLSKRGINVKIDDPYKWSRLSVARLLGKTVYVGHWTKNVKGQEITFTNEPLVTEQMFREAQKALNTPTYTSRKPREKHKYAGLVVDKEGGPCLHYRLSRSGTGYFVYTIAQMNISCGHRKLLLDTVDAAVRRALEKEKERAVFAVGQMEQYGETVLEKHLLEYQEEYKRRAFELAGQEKQRMDIYKDFKNGKISQEENSREQLQRRENVMCQETYFKEHGNEVQRMRTAFGTENPWIQLYLSYSPDCTLNNDTLKKYVSRIVIDKLEIVAVECREQEWYLGLPEGWRKQ
jgi:DNA invertase Pin-like site-specific DNA recombinase